MAGVTLTRQARADLKAVGDWIARDNPPRAVTFVQELRAACEELRIFPLAYPIVGDLAGSPVRKRVFGSYLILYEVDQSDVRILTIVHGARDVGAMLT